MIYFYSNIFSELSILGKINGGEENFWVGGKRWFGCASARVWLSFRNEFCTPLSMQ